MKTLIYGLNNFNFNEFMNRYEKDLKNIFISLEDENIFDLVDFFNIDTMTICNKSENQDILKVLQNENIGLFLLIGSVADEHVNFFRFLNGVQYRINTGEVYEYSSERFHDFEIVEKMINTGYINFSVEISLGLGLYIKDNNLIINLYEIQEDGKHMRIIKESGDLEKIITQYITL